MHDKVIQYVKTIVQNNKIIGPVIDLGGLLADEQEKQYGGVIRRIFSGFDYFTFDMRSDADFVGDVHNTKLVSESFGTVLSLETLEHVEYPQIVVNEIYRILKPGGIAILSTLMCWEEHRCPKDFWRFLPDGILHLFTQAKFWSIEVETFGKRGDSPSGIFVVGRK
jgi:SAM-dependent methyltransferase